MKGATYNEDLDGKRLRSQLERVRALMLDGQWRTLNEISEKTKDPPASVSARLRQLRNDFGFRVERRRRGNPKRGIHEYRVVPKAHKGSEDYKRAILAGEKPTQLSLELFKSEEEQP